MRITKKRTVEESINKFFMEKGKLKTFFLPEDIYYKTIDDGEYVEYFFVIPSKYSTYVYEDKVAYNYMRYDKKYITVGTNKEFGMALQGIHGSRKIFKLAAKVIRDLKINEILN